MKPQVDSTQGFILVRVTNRDKANELVIPQQLIGTGQKCRDVFFPHEVTLFADAEAAEVSCQRCKLGRPESNLEVRGATLKLEIY